MKRRHFLRSAALAFGAAAASPLRAIDFNAYPNSFPLFSTGEYRRIDSAERVFHRSASAAWLVNDPEQARAWYDAGVRHIWLTLMHHGRPDAPSDVFDKAVHITRELGMVPHLLSVPLGHPAPYTEGSGSPGWRPNERYSGHKGWGISTHPPVDRETVESNRFVFEKFGVCDHFLDDDYRCADTPEEVGGCVCPECRRAFIQKAGISPSRWDELLTDLKQNNDTPLLRLWVDYQCDILTDLFRKTEAAAPQVDLGIMVMGMGSERAGIRLDDYRGKLFRVGEWMFNDGEYDQLKKKTIEMFSVLFHRRFTPPGRAFSETTIHPPKSLSKENMASKLVFSTFADVRNTMFMCETPADYWPFFARRMKQEAAFHEVLKGCAPRGPFKHFWGKAARYLAGYSAYSLFLAAGVPFEVCDQLPADGWTFLGDNDARSLDRGEIASNGTVCITRKPIASNRSVPVEEEMEQLFAFRRALLPEFEKSRIPYVEEETPVVCGWYPEVRAVLLWNPEKTAKTVHLCFAGRSTAVELPALESALMLENGDGTYREMRIA